MIVSSFTANILNVIVGNLGYRCTDIYDPVLAEVDLSSCDPTFRVAATLTGISGKATESVNKQRQIGRFYSITKFLRLREMLIRLLSNIQLIYLGVGSCI
jgi:hypothetical protein